VTAGSKQTFSGLSLPVQTGDYIGLYWFAGHIEDDSSGGGGFWYKYGDCCVVNDESTYYFASGDVISLYGIGIEEGEEEDNEEEEPAMALSQVIRSFAAPAAAPYGLAFDGRALWNADYNANRVYQIDPETGRTIMSFAGPGANPAGLTFDGRWLWLA
ncbi:unnamed protein product, partial [marine sediment metagenome]